MPIKVVDSRGFGNFVYFSVVFTVGINLVKY